jgi:hypothetical protein
MFQEHSEPLGAPIKVAPAIHMSCVKQFDIGFTRIFMKFMFVNFIKFVNTFKFWLKSDSNDGHFRCGRGRVSAWNSLNICRSKQKKNVPNGSHGEKWNAFYVQ